MDQFKPGMDVHCTDDGRAKNRVPNELSITPVENGTLLSADMVNGWTFEIVNLIKGLGGTPDRSQENQMVTLLKKIIIYDNVGELKNWIIPKENIPKTYAVLDGSLLNASDYEDNLEELKKRCPSWISGDNIQLPNYNGYFQRFDSSRTIGSTQGDAMQRVSVDVSGNITTPNMPKITIPGLVQNEYVTDSRLIAKLGEVKSTGYYAGSGTWTSIPIYQEKSKKVNIPDNFRISVSGRITQSGTVDSENRPKNVAVIMTVLVGIPKIVEENNG